MRSRGIAAWLWCILLLEGLTPVAVAQDARGGGSDTLRALGPWTIVQEFGPAVEAMEGWVRPAIGARVLLDAEALGALLKSAPREEVGRRVTGLVVSLPMPEGEFERFEVLESPVMAPELQAKFPQFRTYVGRGLDRVATTVRLDLTPRGVSAQILTPEGTIRIDPYVRGSAVYHASYFARDYAGGRHAWACGAHEGPGLALDEIGQTRAGTVRTGDTRRVYRLAVAATAEYTALQGGATQAMNAIVSLVNQLNGVYEVEASIRFVLVANNDQIVYTDALTDPYTNSNNDAMLGENQGVIDGVIGSSNYDIGHVFGTANGGVASIGVVCIPGFKARGVSASPFAITDPYTVQTFCHEVGHQFNARHTFNGINGSCTGAQRSSSDAYEPGSGSTLMSYSSFCATDNVSLAYGELYLNAQSLSRVNGWANGVGSCATLEATGNTAPDVDAGPDYTIPAFTPFVLSATGSDIDLDAVTFCWEQRDLGPAQALAAGDTGTGPIIRSRLGTTATSRSIPTLANVLAGTSSPGEIVPTTSRTVNFRVTARDNRAGAGGVTTDDVAIFVEGTAGPFQITSPNSNVSWTPGAQTVTWDVAGTAVAPISCATVRISYSVNGGMTFPTVLATGVANTGSASVTIPEGPTTQARIRIEAEGNIFFDVSDVNFTVPCEPPVGVVASESYCDRVDVTWSPVVGATGYSVWRGTTSAPGSASLLGTTSDTLFSDTTGVLGTTYHYFVSTAAATCTSGLGTPDTGSRATLTALGTVAASTGQCDGVHLSWPAYSNATAYQVRRNTSNSLIGATLVSVPTIPAALDTTAAAGQNYFYFVRAQTALCGFSPYAAVAQGSRAALPDVPTSVVAGDLSSCAHVEVTWQAAALATGYDVYRNTIDDFGTATLVASTASLQHQDATALPGTPYYYFVVATNACGVSGASVSDLGSRTQGVAIGTQPLEASVCAGSDAEFTVAASGSLPLAYQWFVGATPVGTDSPTLLLPAVALGDDGSIVRCDVTNACGTVSSDAVELSVRVCGPDLFVDASATPGGNGASWATAFDTLRGALAYAALEPTVTTIKVAAGTYTPHASDRDVAFVVRGGLTILAGYPTGGGVDAMRDARANRVILSGDLLGDDAGSFANRSDNSRRVVRVNTGAVVVDGVSIRGGNADDVGLSESGGGVFVDAAGALSMVDCTVSDSQALTLGGGVHALGSISLSRCAVQENAALQGGGLALAGTAMIENSTISENDASSAVPGEGGGGVLLVAGCDATIRHCTIAYNSATSDGGGVLHVAGTVSTDLSIIAENLASIGPDVAGDCGSQGHNLVQQSSGCVGLLVTDLADVDARLEPLADNGGVTPTHALGTYSLAIDAAGVPCEVATDQRGVSRPIAGVTGGDALCDLGAFEAGTVAPPCPADLDDGSGTNYPDAGVDINDLLFFLANFEVGDVVVDLDNGSLTGTEDGGVDINDLLYFLFHFDLGC